MSRSTNKKKNYYFYLIYTYIVIRRYNNNKNSFFYFYTPPPAVSIYLFNINMVVESVHLYIACANIWLFANEYYSIVCEWCCIVLFCFFFCSFSRLLAADSEIVNLSRFDDGFVYNFVHNNPPFFFFKRENWMHHTKLMANQIIDCYTMFSHWNE